MVTLAYLHTLLTYNEYNMVPVFLYKLCKMIGFSEIGCREKSCLYLCVYVREKIYQPIFCMKSTFDLLRDEIRFYVFIPPSILFLFQFLRVKMDNGIKPCCVIVMCYVAVVVHLLLLLWQIYYFFQYRSLCSGVAVPEASESVESPPSSKFNISPPPVSPSSARLCFRSSDCSFLTCQ